jgi:hypothetical protein
MKLLSASLFAALLLSATSWAQSGSPHPQGTVIGSSSATTTIYTGGDGSQSQAKKKSTIIFEVIFMRTSGGRVDYVINPLSIGCSGDGVDEVGTGTIFSAISATAVSVGIEAGYTQCASGSGSQATVWNNSCIQRVGSGNSTHFVIVNPDLYSTRDYSYVCGNGPALIGTVDPGCGSGSIH